MLDREARASDREEIKRLRELADHRFRGHLEVTLTLEKERRLMYGALASTLAAILSAPVEDLIVEEHPHPW